MDVHDRKAKVPQCHTYLVQAAENKASAPENGARRMGSEEETMALAWEISTDGVKTSMMKDQGSWLI